MLTNKKIYGNKFIIFIFATIILFCSGHTFQTVIWQTEYLPVLATVLLIIPVFDAVVNNYINLHSGAFLTILFMVLCTMIVHLGSGFRYYILFVFIVITAYGLSLVYSFDRMVDLYLKIMTVIAIIGILGFYFINQTGLYKLFPVVENVNDFKYATIFIFNTLTHVPYRNCGPFWEPGIFATYLTIALVFEIIFKQSKISRIRIVVFSWAIITTTSSAGYVLLVLALALLFMRNAKAKESKLYAKFIKFFVFMLFIVLLVNYETILQQFSFSENDEVKKLFMENIKESTRALAIKHNLETFAQNPIFGAGITTVTENIRHVADTSTSTYLLSIYGILGLTYTVLWAYVIFNNRKLNIYSKMLIFVIFIIIINKEPHATLLFTWALLFWLLKEHVTYRRCKKSSETFTL